MRRFFDPDNNRLVYINEKADAQMWEKRWSNIDISRMHNPKTLTWIKKKIVDTTKQYLPHGGLLLEGGCGTGEKVAALEVAGHNVIGLDYATSTLQRVKTVSSGLTLIGGDLRALPCKDSLFDGYWSLGVIEHFYDGWEPIAHEMARVIKPGGILFLTFPVMSPLRQTKANLGMYSEYRESSLARRSFYQFALNPDDVISRFGDLGFSLEETQYFNGIMGLSQEFPFLRLPLKVCYKLAHGISESLLSRYCSHVIFLVLRNQKERR